MHTISEIQELILKETGIKTSVKHGRGSMRGNVIFSPMFQNGIYPEFPFEWRRQFIGQFPDHGINFSSASGTRITIYLPDTNGGEAEQYKKERKPKSREDMKVRQWGSENSQLRYDKKVAAYAKKRRGPNGDNMVKYW